MPIFNIFTIFQIYLFFNAMYVSILPEYMYEHYMHARSLEARRGHQIPRNWN